MEAPTSVKIWVPAGQEAFDATAEPTLEDQNGSDILGAAIADTEQVINAMDGRPGQLLTVDTSGERSIWRIDLEANVRKTYDALMVDAHNLLSAYPLAIRDLLNIYKHTADDDALASATKVTYSKIMSGLLGKGRPRLNFNGIANRVVVANDANLNFGAHTDFSIEIIARVPIIAAGTDIWVMKGSDGGVDKRYALRMNSAEQVQLNIDDSANFLNTNSSDTVNDGEWKHLGSSCRRKSTTGTQIYINGLVNGSTGNPTSIGDIDDAAKPLAIGINATDLSTFPALCDIALARIWSRKLSAAEFLSRKNGWTHTPIPVADQEASQTNLITDTDDQDFTGGDIGNWLVSTDGNGTVSYDAGPGAEKTGLITVGGTPGTHTHAILSTSDVTALVPGKRYRLSADVYLPSVNNNWSAVSMFPNAVDATEVFDSPVDLGVEDAWQHIFYEFIAGADITGTFRVLGFSTTIGDLVYYDNVKVERIGCVAEYSHDGISKELGKWMDASGNDLHGTITGCEYIDTPDDDAFGFYLAEFTAVVDWLFWFLQFVQDDGATNASADTFLGWLPLLKSYTFGDLIAGGYAGDHSFGIASRESDVGRVLAEEIHGERPSWTLQWRRLTAAQWADLVEMLRVIKPGNDYSLYPFYVCFNYDAQDPVIWRVRMKGPLAWAYNGANTYKWSPSMTVVRDL